MKKALSLLLSVIMIFALAACNKEKDSAEKTDNITTQNTENSSDHAQTDTESDKEEENKEEELTLRMGTFFDFKYPTQEPLSLITDFLTGLDEGFNATPGLIKAWEMNKEATEYTLHLRENVSFHDGSPFNSEACKYSLEKLGPKFYTTYSSFLESIELIDEMSLKVKFKAPHLFFMEELYLVPALTVNSLDAEGNIQNYIGTGPYILDKYEENVEATLIKNKSYWDSERISDIDIVKWIVIPDGDARMVALESGQVDVVGYSEHSRMIPASSMGLFEKKDGYKAIRENKNAYTAVYSVSSNYVKAPMDDVNLRRAIAHAIDREALVGTVFFGEAVATPYMMNPNFIGGSKKVEALTYDLDRAKKILEEAGYKLENNVLTKDGNEIVLNFITLEDTEYKDFGVFVQAELQKLGIKVNVETLDLNLYFQKMMNSEYDIAFTNSWFAHTVNVIGYLGTMPTDTTGGGLGFAATEEIQRLGNEMLVATDKEEFQKLSDAFWFAMYDACPSAPVYVASKGGVYKDDWTGFSYDSNIFKIDLSKVTKKDE